MVLCENKGKYSRSDQVNKWVVYNKMVF